ncbi:hypothetical protein [Paenibacillus naphthalenovorans]|uniref:hypothetical protein n=1 Tax=Paenibacillus naphthalenovorans TaxID=162209 RepID=UPI00088D5272|nr:hypothetical protein [Paenibacillus naphthalenovorans]GCL71796.1 hypothetical protein PN4B1_17010 [Paenibacillus naphthalenovorans]SDJ60730.1 hypothetical protein SAMN05421868_13420 [Paenibacillus naphthalenovorans]
MSQEVKWEVSEPGILQDDANKEKMRFIAEIHVTDDMSQGERNFAVNYNEMRAMLLKNNLMKRR